MTRLSCSTVQTVRYSTEHYSTETRRTEQRSTALIVCMIAQIILFTASIPLTNEAFCFYYSQSGIVYLLVPMLVPMLGIVVHDVANRAVALSPQYQY